MRIAPNQKFGEEIPSYIGPIGALQKLIHRSCLRTINIDLPHHIELDTVAISKCTDLLRRTWLLATKLVARKRKNFQPLGFQLFVELNELLVILGGFTSFASDVCDQRHLPIQLAETEGSPIESLRIERVKLVGWHL